MRQASATAIIKFQKEDAFGPFFTSRSNAARNKPCAAAAFNVLYDPRFEVSLRIADRQRKKRNE